MIKAPRKEVEGSTLVIDTKTGFNKYGTHTVSFGTRFIKIDLAEVAKAVTNYLQMPRESIAAQIMLGEK